MKYLEISVCHLYVISNVSLFLDGNFNHFKLKLNTEYVKLNIRNKPYLLRSLNFFTQSHY